MSTESNNRTLQIISAHHGQIVAFAKESFAAAGRGVIVVGFPNVPPGATAVGSTDMKYVTLDEMRELFAGDPNEDAAITIRMIETFDPSRQAVVTAHIAGLNPISIKLRLDPPFVVDQAEGVH